MEWKTDMISVIKSEFPSPVRFCASKPSNALVGDSMIGWR
jgi:hypothetical protein